MKDWEKIRAKRKDLSVYLVHLVRDVISEVGHSTSCDILKKILLDGYLKPEFGLRKSNVIGGTNRTIQGSYPAVCLTEQPLNFILISSYALGISRYPLYGIAFRKDYLYEYGGRPVIYGDKNMLELLHQDIQYLWVRYEPVPSDFYNGYPIDWTHEREWRCRSKNYPSKDATWDTNGVPLLLPHDYLNHKNIPDFKILVHRKEEVDELKEWIGKLNPYAGQNKWIETYFRRLPKTDIISFEEVSEHIDHGDDDWARIETIPFICSKQARKTTGSNPCK